MQRFGSIPSDWDADSMIAPLNILAVAANTTVVIPAGYSILQIIVENTTANAITGGLKIGTTTGGTQVVVALAVAANSIQAILDATILKRVFSRTANQTLYVQAVTAWNSANLNIHFVLRKFI